jgi:acyl-CoA reductase-like NAD-dependent aldehyde dehydrogenase
MNLKLVELAQKFFPPGVVQGLSGDDELGPWLTEHPVVDMISFTGSTATGRKVMASCSKTLKRVILELGGNDPAIVCADCDVKAVAPKIATMAVVNSGQVCVAIKRIFVHESIYPALLEAMVEYVKNLKIGDGFEDDTFIGPMANKEQYERVKDLLAQIKKDQLKVVLGGIDALPDKKGFFISPTIIDDPPEDSRVVVEEPFGTWVGASCQLVVSRRLTCT